MYPFLVVQEVRIQEEAQVLYLQLWGEPGLLGFLGISGGNKMFFLRIKQFIIPSTTAIPHLKRNVLHTKFFF